MPYFPDSTDSVYSESDEDFDYNRSRASSILQKDDILTFEEIELSLKSTAKRILLAFSQIPSPFTKPSFQYKDMKAEEKYLGYVQGMSSMAVSLCYNFYIAKKVFEHTKLSHKLYFEPKFIEEEIFYTFFGLFEHLGLHKYYKVGFEALQKGYGCIESCLQDNDP